MRKESNLSQEVIEDFLKFVHETVQQCRCIYNYADKHGFDNFLIYNLSDVGVVQIGCVEGGNFLLDCEFVYKHFVSYWNENCGNVSVIPAKSLFYKLLYQAKIICSYSVYFRRPLHTIRMGGSEKRQYFCIGKDSVGYTDSMLNWL